MQDTVAAQSGTDATAVMRPTTAGPADPNAGVAAGSLSINVPAHTEAAAVAEPDPSTATAADQPDGLTPGEAALLDAARTGLTADLDGLTVGGDFLALLMSEHEDGPLRHAPLVLRGGHVDGLVDLSSRSVTRPLRLIGCHLSGGLDLTDAILATLNLEDCTVAGGISAARCRVGDAIAILRTRVDDAIVLRAARITGGLVLDDTEAGSAATALDADGIEVAGGCSMARFTGRGQIGLGRAAIGRSLDVRGAAVASDERAMTLTGASIGDDFLMDDATFAGTVHATDLTVAGTVSGERLVVDHPAEAVTAERLVVGKGVRLSGARIRGPVRLTGARIGGALEANDIDIDGGDIALSAAAARIDGRWDMNRSRLVGTLDMVDASIAGGLGLAATRIFGAESSINADRTRFGGTVDLARVLTVGQMTLSTAEIRGSLLLVGATLKVESGAALTARSLHVTGDVALGQGLQTIGAVMLEAARIDGQCDLRTSHIRSAAIGRGNAPGKRLGPTVRASSGDEIALSLAGARVQHLVMPQRADERPRGIVDLTRCTVVLFEDWASAWPRGGSERQRAEDGRDIDHLRLDGFVCTRLVNPSGRSPEAIEREEETAGRARIAWLDGQHEADTGRQFKSAPWTALAATLEAQGLDADARLLTITRLRRERRSHASTAGARWRNRLADWGVLYGYSPWRALGWLALSIGVFAILWGAAFARCTGPGCLDESVFVITNKAGYTEARFGRTYPHFHPLAYSLDLAVPLIDFGYASHWRPNIAYGPLGRVTLPASAGALLPGNAKASGDLHLELSTGILLYLARVLQQVLGLALSALALAAFMGWIRPDRRT